MTDKDVTAEVDDEPGWTRPFADILTALDKGRTHNELSTKMQQLVGDVKATGKKGSLHLVITVSPLPKSDGVLEVIDTVTLKAPAPARKSSLFYADSDANLVRENPDQPQLPLHQVSADPSDRPLRKAD